MQVFTTAVAENIPSPWYAGITHQTDCFRVSLEEKKKIDGSCSGTCRRNKSGPYFLWE